MDSISSLCRDLEVVQAVLLSQSTPFCLSYNSGRAVDFVCDEYLEEFAVGVALNFFDPAGDSVEARPIGHIVHDSDAMCPAVIAGGNSSKPCLRFTLLAGGVPQLQANGLAFDGEVGAFLH